MDGSQTRDPGQPLRRATPVPREVYAAPWHRWRSGRSVAGEIPLTDERPHDVRITLGGVVLSAVIVAGMALESSLVTLIASLAALGASLVAPMVGVVILTFVAPLPRPLILPTPGLHVAIIAAIFLGMVFRLPLDRPRLRMPPPSILLLSAFMLYATVQLVGGLLDDSWSSRGFEIAQIYAQIMTGALTFVAAFVVLRGRSPHPALAGALIAAVFAAGLGLLENFGADQLGLLVGRSLIDNRITGPFGDPNYYGSYLAAMATLAAASAVIAPSARLRFVLIAVSAIIGFALVLTQSRGALLAVAAGLITVGFNMGRRAGFAAIAVVLTVAMIGYPLFSEWRFGDLAGPRITDSAEASGRLDAALPGLDMFAQSPIFGIGIGRFIEETPSGLTSHNWYVSVAAEMGMVGIVLWALFIASVLVALRKVGPSARTVGVSVLVAWMVASLTIEVPAAYAATGTVLVVLAAALSARWPVPPESGPAGSMAP